MRRAHRGPLGTAARRTPKRPEGPHSTPSAARAQAARPVAPPPPAAQMAGGTQAPAVFPPGEDFQQRLGCAAAPGSAAGALIPGSPRPSAGGDRLRRPGGWLPLPSGLGPATGKALGSGAESNDTTLASRRLHTRGLGVRLACMELPLWAEGPRSSPAR